MSPADPGDGAPKPTPRRARHRARQPEGAPEAAAPEADVYRAASPMYAEPVNRPDRPRHLSTGADETWDAEPVASARSDDCAAQVLEVASEPAQPERTQPEPAAPEPATTGRPASGRAGRDLPVAIGVGLVLGAAVVASLLWWTPAFLGVVVLGMVLGTWEMVRAVHSRGLRPPLVPLLIGGPTMAVLAWFGGPEALPYGLLGTAVAVMVWRLADGPEGYQRDVTAAVLIMVYVPFLGSFAALLATAPDGRWRVLATLICVVLADTGGYAFGVLFGRHPMAPSISPKKSWEGFAGSLLAAAVGGALVLYFLLGVSWWYGVAFGAAVAVAAALGDLGESLLKRDLAIKDMGNLLPGHGGAMERLDSVLFAAPTAYVVLMLVAPVR